MGTPVPDTAMPICRPRVLAVSEPPSVTVLVPMVAVGIVVVGALALRTRVPMAKFVSVAREPDGAVFTTKLVGLVMLTM